MNNQISGCSCRGNIWTERYVWLSYWPDREQIKRSSIQKAFNFAATAQNTNCSPKHAMRGNNWTFLQSFIFIDRTVQIEPVIAAIQSDYSGGRAKYHRSLRWSSERISGLNFWKGPSLIHSYSYCCEQVDLLLKIFENSLKLFQFVQP